MSTIQTSTSASYAAQWQYIQALQQQQASSGAQQGSDSSSTQSFDPFAGLGDALSVGQGGGGMPCPPLSTDAMSAMIDAQEQSGSSNANGLSNYQQKVFGELDADGDGKVTGDEIKSAFGSENSDAASYVMNKLDTDGDGSISQSEFAAGTTKGAGHHHHMHGMGGGQGTQAQDPLQQLLEANGANSNSTANSDGSNTTTITYADGSKVSMTSAASSDNSSGNTTSNSMQQNLLEQLIKMQSQLIQSSSASASNSLATI